jgi:hypothetical protein
MSLDPNLRGLRPAALALPEPSVAARSDGPSRGHGSRRHAYRSRVWAGLVLRPIIPAEARITPTERPTRRGDALTANGIDCGASFAGFCSFRPADAVSREGRKGASDGFRPGTKEARPVRADRGARVALRSAAGGQARDGDHVAPRRRRAPGFALRSSVAGAALLAAPRREPWLAGTSPFGFEPRVAARAERHEVCGVVGAPLIAWNDVVRGEIVRGAPFAA